MQPAGQPFFKYNVIDMARQVEVEVGFPVAAPVNRVRTWDVTSTPDGERWGCRLEVYHDEPGQDMSEWETGLAFKLAD